MPRKDYRKPGSDKDNREAKARALKTIKALDSMMDGIIDRMKDGTAPNSEETRFVKRYPELRKAAVATLEAIGKEQKEEAKGSDIVRKFEAIQMKYLRQAEIFEKWTLLNSKHKDLLHTPKLTKEALDQVYKDASYYTCWLCNTLHKVGELCPFTLMEEDVIASGKKIEYTQALIEKAIANSET